MVYEGLRVRTPAMEIHILVVLLVAAVKKTRHCCAVNASGCNRRNTADPRSSISCATNMAITMVSNVHI
jgi:hypothetical protein